VTFALVINRAAARRSGASTSSSEAWKRQTGLPVKRLGAIAFGLLTVFGGQPVV
jgi:hypothetical protein